MKSLFLIIGIFMVAFALTAVKVKKEQTQNLDYSKIQEKKPNEQYYLQGDVIYKEGKPDYKIKPIRIDRKNTIDSENESVLEIDPD